MKPKDHFGEQFNSLLIRCIERIMPKPRILPWEEIERQAKRDIEKYQERQNRPPKDRPRWFDLRMTRRAYIWIYLTLLLVSLLFWPVQLTDDRGHLTSNQVYIAFVAAAFYHTDTQIDTPVVGAEATLLIILGFLFFEGARRKAGGATD